MRLNHIFYLLVVLLLVLCGLLLFYAGSDTKLFYCVEALVGLALVFLVIFYSRVLRPLRSIANGIDMLRGQDFSSRLIKVGQYEADLIIDVFNPMMEQLKNERLRLREQNTFLDLLLEASPMGVVATNMRGDVSLTYLIALLHNDKVHKVIELIQEAQKSNRRSGMSTRIGDEEIDDYSREFGIRTL